MKLEADARIAFPRDVVYKAYRDRLVELVPHLPNVRAIRVESRTDAVEGHPSRTDFVNVWEARADIPKLLQGIVKPEALAWVDRAAWDDTDWSCDWTIEPRVFAEQVRCAGRTTYRVEGEHTLQEIRGILEVSPAGIPGVPRMLASRVAPAVEKFIVNLIRPNFLSVAEGLERYLEGTRSVAQE